MHAIPGPMGEVPVIGVAAAATAQDARPSEDPARYNLFRIERLGPVGPATWANSASQRLGDEITLRLQMRIY